MNSRERLESHASHATQFFVTVSVIKTKSATIAFSFFHLFFSFVTVILELIGPKKPLF